MMEEEDEDKKHDSDEEAPWRPQSMIMTRKCTQYNKTVAAYGVIFVVAIMVGWK